MPSLLALAVAAAALVAWLWVPAARYRDIFFAMLSLAFSMILYGTLVKTETLGSTDGFHVAPPTFLGWAPQGESACACLFWLVLGIGAAAAFARHRLFPLVAGALAIPIRDNEMRVEYLGISVGRAIHVKFVIAGALAGAGGALVALAVGHIDPDMTYWTTSGEFVFVTILAGAGTVLRRSSARRLRAWCAPIATDMRPIAGRSCSASVAAAHDPVPAQRRRSWSLRLRRARNGRRA